MKTRARLAVLLWTILILLCAADLRAAAWDNGYPDTVRVGYFDYGGFLDCDSNGNYSGYGYDYLMEIANYTGWNYEFVPGTWESLLRKLAAGEIDLLCPAQYTAERAKLYDYSRYDCGTEYTALFVPKDAKDIYYNDVESFRGMRIAMVRSSYPNGRFKTYAQENHIPYTAVYYDDWGKADQALHNGEVDARLSGSLRHSDNEKVVLKIAPEPFFFITGKGNDSVLSGVNDALEQIRTWDTNFNAHLYEKHYGADLSSQLAFTRSEAVYIDTCAPLRVVYNTSWAPLSRQKDGRADGILPDLLNALAQSSGLRFIYVPADSTHEMESLVKSGQADLIGYCPPDRASSVRQSGISLTKSYVSVPIALVCRTGASASNLKMAALPDGQEDLARIVRMSYPGISIHTYPDINACMRAVRRGEADGVFENAYLLTQLAKQYTSLELLPTSFLQYSLCLGVSDNCNPMLLTILNKAITQLDPGQINASALDHTLDTATSQNSMYILRRILLIVIIIAAICLLLLTYKWKTALEHYAFEDPLTGYPNQTKFTVDASRRLRDKQDGRYAILCFDIDRFKVINDLHGYRMGNRLLCAISKALAAHISGDELFCRAAGDNFILLLDNKGELEKRARFLLERACDAARALDDDLRFTVSAGIYVVDEPVDGIHIAIDRANLARQSAKCDRQAPLAFYTNEMRRRVLREQDLENRLDGALAHGEFEVYYQPKCTVEDGRVVGAEALVRWRTSDGLILPDEFIPVFENNGSIIRLDLYVFRQVCAHLRKWLDAGYTPVPVSVNLSRVHLYQSDFCEEYLSIMRSFGIPFYYLELELTESAMFENQQQIIRIMERLRDSGILVSMDDFGNGYSSLNLLKDLPIDSLKIDREFFSQSANTIRGQKIIYSIVSMARQLDILVVSEGVETQEQVDFLQKIKCHVAQGYYFSKPMPMDEFETFAFSRQKKMSPAVPQD